MSDWDGEETYSEMRERQKREAQESRKSCYRKQQQKEREEQRERDNESNRKYYENKRKQEQAKEDLHRLERIAQREREYEEHQQWLESEHEKERSMIPVKFIKDWYPNFPDKSLCPFKKGDITATCIDGKEKDCNWLLALDEINVWIVPNKYFEELNVDDMPQSYWDWLWSYDR
jgi:hypothetical protein